MSVVTSIAVAKGQDGNVVAIATAREEPAPDTLWRLERQDWHRLRQPPGQAFFFDTTAVARNADGRLEAVVWGEGVLHASQTAPGGDLWTGWQSLGQPPPEPFASKLALVANRDGRLELFVLDVFGAAWHAWQTTPGDDWTGWYPLGAPSDEVSLSVVDPPVVARNEDGRLELFMRGNDELLWHCWQREPGSRPWAAWSPLRSPSDQVTLSGPPVVARNRDGRLEVFAQASDGAIWHRWQPAAGAEPWAPWSSLGVVGDGAEFDVGVGANADGRLALLAVDTKLTSNSPFLQQRHQTAPNNGWSAWKPIPQDAPGPVDSLIVTLDGEGKLHLLMRDLNHEGLFELVQTAPNSAAWETGLLVAPPPVARAPE